MSVRARVVVNATGRVDRRRAGHGYGDARANAVRATKGVHIAVPRERLATHAALTLLSPIDGRVMFALPSTATTIIGTTDTPTDERPEDVRASRADVDYLLATANSFFPAARLTPADVVAAWAGIRPLVASGFTGDPASASREHRIDRSAIRHDLGVGWQADDVSIDGRGGRRRGRAIARQTAEHASTTDRVPLPGGDIRVVRRSAARGRAGGGRCGRGAPTRGSTRLAVARGRRAHDAQEPALARRIVRDLPYLLAEVVYAVERENGGDARGCSR